MYYVCRYIDLVTKSGPLPTFVEPSFQMSYYLNETGILVARRIVNIISYSCPDITYAPSLYPITCLLLHYMSGTALFKVTALARGFLSSNYSFARCFRGGMLCLRFADGGVEEDEIHHANQITL